MTEQLFQHFLVAAVFLFYCLLTKKRPVVFVYLISLPFVFYYLLDTKVVFLASLLAISVYEFTLSSKKIYLFTFFIGLLAALLLLRSSSALYHPDLNIIDFQRGEHVSFQTNLVAKIFHNKSSLIYPYLDKLFNEISLSRFFAEGKYRSFSKYVPLGYLFPWDLVLLLFSLRLLGKKLINILLLFSVTAFPLLITFFDGSYFYLSLAALVILSSLFTSTVLAKLPLLWSLLIICLNTGLLYLFALPINIHWDLNYRP